jgi:hypothetical protein
MQDGSHLGTIVLALFSDISLIQSWFQKGAAYWFLPSESIEAKIAMPTIKQHVNQIQN